MVAFGKGPRMCQGMNLAYAELYLTLAELVTRYDLELHDIVKERDVDFTSDYFIAEVRSDSKGIRVTVKRRS
jgi:cytochrome P450